jgi:hypothetical protein
MVLLARRHTSLLAQLVWTQRRDRWVSGGSGLLIPQLLPLLVTTTASETASMLHHAVSALQKAGTILLLSASSVAMAIRATETSCKLLAVGPDVAPTLAVIALL